MTKGKPAVVYHGTSDPCAAAIIRGKPHLAHYPHLKKRAFCCSTSFKEASRFAGRRVTRLEDFGTVIEFDTADVQDGDFIHTQQSGVLFDEAEISFFRIEGLRPAQLWTCPAPGLTWISTKIKMPLPKITFKALHVYERMSQESTAYDAIVLIDGVPSFTAENNGHGGCDHYRPLYNRSKDKLDHTTFEAAMEKLRSYLAEQPASTGEVRTPTTVDELVANALEEATNEKRKSRVLKRLLSTVYIFDGASRSLRTYRAKGTNPPPISRLIAEAKEKYRQSIIVNELPESEAWTILKNFA